MLDINQNVKCPQCGKGGATMVDKSGKYGLCLKCALKKIEKRIKDEREAKKEKS